jgi:hypothetical protein
LTYSNQFAIFSKAFMKSAELANSKTPQINLIKALGEISRSSADNRQRLPDTEVGDVFVQSFQIGSAENPTSLIRFSRVYEKCADPYFLLSQEIDGQFVTQRISKYPWDSVCNIAKTLWTDLETGRKAYKPFILD